MRYINWKLNQINGMCRVWHKEEKQQFKEKCHEWGKRCKSGINELYGILAIDTPLQIM